MAPVPQVGFADFLKKQRAARPYGTPFFAESAYEVLVDQNAEVEKAKRLASMSDDKEVAYAKGKKKVPRTRGLNKPFTGAPGKKDESGARMRRDVVPVKDYVEPPKAMGKQAQRLAAALQRENDERADSKSPILGMENDDEVDENEVEAEILETDEEMDDHDTEEELPLQRRVTRGMKAKENKKEIECDPSAHRRLTRGMKVKETEEEQQAIAASLDDQSVDIMTSFFEDAMAKEHVLDTNGASSTGDIDGFDDSDGSLFGDDSNVADTIGPRADTWQPYGANEKTSTVPTRFLGLARLPADFADEFKALFDKQFTVGRDNSCQFTSEPVTNSNPELEDIGIEFWGTVKDAEYAEVAMGGMVIAGKKLQVVFAMEE